MKNTSRIFFAIVVGSLALISRSALAQFSVGLSAQQFTQIDVPGASLTIAFSINPRGDIVGVYVDTSGTDHGFLLSKGKFTTIDVPTATDTIAYGIDPQGDIVGLYFDGSGNGHGFLLSDGTFTTIERPSMYREPFRRLPLMSTREATSWGTMLTLAATLMVFCSVRVNVRVNLLPSDVPGAVLTDVGGINPRGDIVGDYIDSSGNYHGYLLSK